MRAWHVEAFGAPAEVMRLVQVPDLQPGAGQVAVRVAACTLGFPDVLMCRAGYQHRPTLPFSPGADFYGRSSRSVPASTSLHATSRSARRSSPSAPDFTEG